MLLRALRENTGALPELDPSQDVPYWLLAEAVQADEDVSRLLRAAQGDSVIARELSEAFAGAVPLAEWEEPVAAGTAEQVPADAHSEWAEIVALPERGYGITLPEDSFAGDHLSLFQHIGDVVRRTSVWVVPGHPPTLELRLAGGECGFPYRGQCQPGGSCRDCVHTWIEPPGKPRGYACRCEDEGTGLLVAEARADEALSLPVSDR